MKERDIALKILTDVEQKGSYSNLVLAGHLETLPQRDRSLTTALVYGVLQNKLRLDHIISAYSRLPMNKISPDVLNILRIGVYQAEWMDKIPDYAIVNESILLTKKHKKTSAAGFVNAVLRGVLRKDRAVVYPKDRQEYLSLYYSCPLWLCRMWDKECGDGLEDLLRASNQPPPFSVRVNTLKVTAEEFAEKAGGQVSALCGSGVILDAGRSVADDTLFQKGWYYPQDVASMLPSVILDPAPGETVMDVCAAPGGKTTHLAQLMNNQGKIIAFDIHEHKLKLVEDAARRMGISIVTVRQQDAAMVNPAYVECADRVLVDAPCSGLGILRRKPEIKYVRTPEDIEALSALQAEILSAAAAYVKPGGVMVYSTCTISRRENEDRVQAFLLEHPAFEPAEIADGKCSLQLLPQQHNTDGFFIAKLRKMR